MSPLLLAIFLGVVVFAVYLGLDAYFGKKQTLEHLKHATGMSQEYYTPDGADALTEITDEPSETALGIERFLRIIGVNVEESKKELKPQLQHAGIFSPDAAAYFLIYRRLIGYFVSILGAFLFMIKDTTSLQYAYWIGGLLLMIIGVFGAQLFVYNATQRRKKNLLRAFPDTLDLMVVCVESGLALDAALARVTAEIGRAYPEINEELNRTRLELTLLNDRTRALINLGERTNLVPFRSLVAALIQTERFGTGLSDTLRVLSDDYRHTRILIIENKAGRLPALMTIPLILLLLPALFIIIMGPAYITVKAAGGIFGDGK
ncbi:MAG: type II secretion system F family protein [Rickettsiales bacterium]|nr:type II secretion system F family protein [Rickettsiales bacterium]